MHYLIAGLAKSGTTRLFAQLQSALTASGQALSTFFEPDTDEALAKILRQPGDTLTKVLVGRVSTRNTLLTNFDRHILIYRDPRDQFLSMLLYLFYDFQVNGDVEGFELARDALAAKVAAPREHSTIDLYNLVAARVGRGPVAVFERLHKVQEAYESAFRPFMLRYETLLDGEALEGLAHYLGFPLAKDAQVPAEYARVARSRGYGEWRRWLNQQDIEFIDAAWGDAIERLGYEKEPAGEELLIDPANSLDYVAHFDPRRSGFS